MESLSLNNNKNRKIYQKVKEMRLNGRETYTAKKNING